MPPAITKSFDLRAQCEKTIHIRATLIIFNKLVLPSGISIFSKHDKPKSHWILLNQFKGCHPEFAENCMCVCWYLAFSVAKSTTRSCEIGRFCSSRVRRGAARVTVSPSAHSTHVAKKDKLQIFTRHTNPVLCSRVFRCHANPDKHAHLHIYTTHVAGGQMLGAAPRSGASICHFRQTPPCFSFCSHIFSPWCGVVDCSSTMCWLYQLTELNDIKKCIHVPHEYAYLTMSVYDGGVSVLVLVARGGVGFNGDEPDWTHSIVATDIGPSCTPNGEPPVWRTEATSAAGCRAFAIVTRHECWGICGLAL